jgi:hypothetical protein
MTNKRIRLPKENVVEPEGARSSGFIGDDDVTGHLFPNPAPPADLTRRSPSQGGEIVPTDEEPDGLRSR